MNADQSMLEFVPVCLKGRGKIWSRGHRDMVGPRLGTAISHLVRRVRRITVWLEDVNGPRGGIDKRCRITMHLKRGGRVAVEAQATTRYAAIAKASDRARAALSRELERQSRAGRHELSGLAQHNRFNFRRPISRDASRHVRHRSPCSVLPVNDTRKGVP